VYHAALTGNAMRSNPFSQLFQQLRDEALQQMRNDLEAEWSPTLYRNWNIRRALTKRWPLSGRSSEQSKSYDSGPG